MAWFASFLAILIASLLGIFAFKFPWAWLAVGLCIAEFALSFHLVKENERIVPILLGSIRKECGTSLTLDEQNTEANPAASADALARLPQRGLFGSGLFFFPFPLYEVRRYPFPVQLLEVAVGKVITPSGRTLVPQNPNDPNSPREPRSFGPAELDIGATVNYQWNLSRLADAAKNLPPPTGPDEKIHPALKELMEREVDDAVRRVIAGKTWYDVYFDRGGIEEGVESILLNLAPLGERDTTFVKGGITERPSLNIVLQKVDLPEELRKTINLEQAALFEAQKTRVAAEAERYKRQQEGLGDADAREVIFRVIRGANPQEGDANRVAEFLRTLERMAQGPATTIFAPGLSDILSQVFGRTVTQDLMSILFAPGNTPQQRRELLQEALAFFRGTFGMGGGGTPRGRRN